MFRTHNSRGFLICFAVSCLVLTLFVKDALDGLENKAIDARFKLRGNRPVDSRIVVITIDEPSIEKLGRWPWPRATHGNLIRLLRKVNPGVIAFDSIFNELDTANPQSDMDFAEATGERDDVIIPIFFKGGIHGPSYGAKMYGEGIALPYDPLPQKCRQGFVNMEPDSDGVTRRAVLYAVDNGDKEVAIPSFAANTYAIFKKKNFSEIINELPVVVSSDPQEAINELSINFAFDEESASGYPYPIYSYVDVLGGKVDLSVFKDKIVFIGATATALFDMKAIPFISQHPGVMLHANVVDNLLNGNYLTEVLPGWVLLMILSMGILLGLVLPRMGPWRGMGLFALIVGGELAFSYWLFITRNIVFPMVAPLFVGLGSYGGILFYHLLIEEKEKRKIKGNFKQYMSSKLLDLITKDPSKLKLGGEEREVSIFFLDIAGFTTMSEALKPTQLVEVMNVCLNEFSKIILKHDGLINKYIGDCIMAFWNAPADQPDHAAQACLAALDCINILPEINRKFQEKGLPSIDCRVGINSGMVVVGNMGSDDKFDYTVLGDPVNLASRLEGANKQYHSRIMVSDVTFEKAREKVEARDLDLIRVKGKKEPRKVFEILCRRGEMNNDMVEGRKFFHQGLSLYRQRSFAEAIESFQRVFDHLPNDHVSRVYLERARTFVNHPPPALWDGVYEMTTK